MAVTKEDNTDFFDFDDASFENPQMQTASVSPTSVQDIFEFDTGPVDPSDSPSVDPETVQRRTDKAHYALEDKSPGKDALLNQFAVGDEPYLRQSLAAAKSVEDRTKRLQLIKEVAGSINRPLTQAESDEIMNLATATDRNPKTILEELYGEKIAKGIPDALSKSWPVGTSTPAPNASTVAEEYIDQSNATAKHIARTQIAKTVAEDAEQTWNQQGWGSTIKSYAKQLVPFWSYANLTTAVANAPTGFSLEFGRTIEEEIEYLYTLRPSAFKEELTAAVRKIAEDSPLDAYLFAQGVVAYGGNDQALDTIFGAADMTSFLPFLKGARAAGSAARAVKPSPINPENFVKAATPRATPQEFVQALKSKLSLDRFKRPTEAAPSPAPAAVPEVVAVPDAAFNGDLMQQLDRIFLSESHDGSAVPLTNIGFRQEEVDALKKAGLANADGSMSRQQWGNYLKERERRDNVKRAKHLEAEARKKAEMPVQPVGQPIQTPPMKLWERDGVSITWDPNRQVWAEGNLPQRSMREVLNDDLDNLLPPIERVQENTAMARVVNFDAEDVLEKANKKFTLDPRDTYNEGKKSLYAFMEAVGRQRSIINDPEMLDRDTVVAAADALTKGQAKHPEQEKRVAAFLSETFDPWPEYKYVRGDRGTANNKFAFTPGEDKAYGRVVSSEVSLDPVANQTQIGTKIAEGKPLYKGANTLPKALGRDADLTFEHFLWHETAHNVILRHDKQTIAQYEDLINAAAFLKLHMQRLTPGIRASRKGVDLASQTPEWMRGTTPSPNSLQQTYMPRQTPVPVAVNKAPTPSQPSTPAVVFTDKLPSTAPATSVSERIGPKPQTFSVTELDKYEDAKIGILREAYGLRDAPSGALAFMPSEIVNDPKLVTEWVAVYDVVDKVANRVTADAFKKLDKGYTKPGGWIDKRKPVEGQPVDLSKVRKSQETEDAITQSFRDMERQEENYGQSFRQFAKELGQDYEVKVQQAFEEGTYDKETLRQLAESAYASIDEFLNRINAQHGTKVADIANAFKIDIKPVLRTGPASNTNLPEFITKAITTELEAARAKFTVTPKAPAKSKIQPYIKTEDGIMTVYKKGLENQWKQKPWTKTKTKGVKPYGSDADFPTPQDWVDFRVAKERISAAYPKKQGVSYADHQNTLNEMALQSIRMKKQEGAIVANNLMRDTAKAGELDDVAVTTGNMAQAETDAVLKQVYDEIQGKDVLDDGMNLRKRTSSLFDTSTLDDGADTIPRQRVDRIMQSLRNNAVRLLKIPLNNAAIARLPEEAVKVAIEEAKKSLSSTYNRVNDAFLDISLGGPFGVIRPEDSLVNLYTVNLKMGRPDGRLFDNATQAAVYGTEQYGLNPNQFTVLQQGEGFYLNIAKAVDETLQSVRDAIVQTNNKSSPNWLTTFMGFMRTSDDLLGDLANSNRILATTAAQELHRIFLESAQTIGKDLSKVERSQLEAIWIKNRDHEYLDAGKGGEPVTKRGMFYETLQEFENAFFDRFQQLPSEKQTEAYFTYVQLNDMDYILRNLALHRDMGRMGAENMRIFYQGIDINGAPENKASRNFAGRFTDRLPLDDQTEDFGIWYYDPVKKKGEFFLRSQVTPDVSNELTAALESRGFKIIEVVNPLEKPLTEAAGTNEIINFMVVKNYENTKFDWAILPRQPGGHVEYGDQFFVKQPRLRRSTTSGSLRHVYEGDTSLLNAATQAEAERLSAAADVARRLLRDGKEAELKTYLYQNLPYDIETWKSFFKEEVDDAGNIKPALMHLDDPITWTYTGRNTSDMDHFKGMFGNYSNFFNGVRSQYNLFAQGVDKKYLGSRDPDLPRVLERGTEASPLYSLEKPRLLSPLETLNKSIANVSRSRHMNDYKTSAVESFIEEFKDVMKTRPEDLRRNPVYYFHNPQWDTETTNKNLLAAAQSAHRAHKYFIGTETDLGSKLWWAQSKVVDMVYKKLGQEVSNIVTEKYLPTVKDPFTYARSIAFHSKLGLFNPVQLFLQAQSFAHVLAVAGPTQGLSSAYNAFLYRRLALTEDPKILSYFARMSSDPKMFKESFGELKKTGYYNVGGEVAWRDDVFDPQLFDSTVGKFLEKGTMFFNEGERFVRMSAWDAAFTTWRKANPTAEITNKVRNDILKRADLMAVNMTRASNAAWQQGLFSIPTQFLSFQARLAEQLLPGFSSRLTSQEKLRGFLTYSAIYGVPMGLGAATAVYPYHEDIRQAALERGINLDNRLLQLFNEGLVDTAMSVATGKEYNINERYGPKGTSMFKEIVNGDQSLAETLLGASGSIIGDMISSAEPATNALLSLFSDEYTPPTMDDFLEVTKNISTVNNGLKAWYMYNQGRYFTKNGSVIMDNATGYDAFMQGVFGVTPESATDTFVMIKSRKEQRAAEQAAEKEIIKYYRKAIREYNEGNNDNGDNYMKRARAWLISSGIQPSKYGQILSQAVKGNETLFNAVREDFWRKAPTSQIESRRQMLQGE